MTLPVGVMIVTYLQPEKVTMKENWESKKPSFVSGSAICRQCDSDKVFHIYGPHFPHLQNGENIKLVLELCP